MKLTDEEKRMLDGKHGQPVKMAMDILVAIGEIYGAEKLIPIKSAHIAGLSLKSHGIAGMEWAEDIARSGAKVCVPTTLNVVGVDRSRELNLPAEWSTNQLRIEQAYECMGCYGTSTCVPYYMGFVPRFRESIAWAESSAVVFTNSVLGARDNREGGPTAMASGLAGRTPLYGLHLDENRKGDVLYKITADLRDIADFGGLGAYVGKRVGTKIPVFDGISHPAIEELVYLGAALASSGGVAMFHVSGVTPEAPTAEAAFGDKKHETVLITNREIEEGKQQLTSARDSKVDYVALGCPHYSVRQLQEVVELLRGRRISKDVMMWVHTNVAIKGIAQQLGYVRAIEESGAIVTQDLCTVLGNPESLGVKTLATNSAKMAFYAPGSNGLGAWFGETKRCIDAAVSGYWK